MDLFSSTASFLPDGPIEIAVHTSGLSEPTDRKRVLHLINGEHYAGAEKVQDLLALRLPELGWDVSFACVRPDQFSARRASEVPLYETPMTSRFDLRAARQVARLIDRETIDLLHTHTPRTALVGNLAALRTGVPMVHHVHGQTASEMNRHWFGRMSAAVERVSLHKAARLIAVSESVRQSLIDQGIAADRITVVPNGVPVPQQQRLEPAPDGPWTIGTVALFRPRKGTEILLRAVAGLRDEGLPVRLRAIGRFETNDYEAEVRSIADELGIASHVDWVGFTTDVASEIVQCDVMVLPSLLAEGLPMVVIEAMAAGVPVVGTRVDGTRDVIRHEIDGLLAEPGGVASLQEQLRRLVTGDVDWFAMRKMALRRHAERFSDESMARGVASVYRDVLSRTVVPFSS